MKNALRSGSGCLLGKQLMLGCALLSGFPVRAATAPAILARHASGEEPPTEKVRFGARLGANLVNMNFNQGYPKPAVPVGTTWKPGAVAGFFWQIPLRNNLFLRQEYLFAQMSSAVKSTSTTYQLRYLSLPLLLQYKLLPKLAVAAGPQFDLLLQGKARSNGATTTITHDTEERSIGATAGLEFFVTKSWSLDARYMQGLNHIGIGQRSDVQEFKHQMVQVAAAVRF